MDRITPDSAETSRLLDALQSGDTAAFDRLLARHRPYLRRVVELGLDPRLRPRVDPSDVVQETQLEAVQRMPDYLQRRPMPFRLWLRKTAQKRLYLVRRQHIAVARRAVGREVALPDRSSIQLAHQLIATGSTPSQRVAQRELAQQVRQAVARLGDADREILLMRHFEGLSNQEVASVLDIDPGTARKRHGRAVLRLRQILLESGWAGD